MDLNFSSLTPGLGKKGRFAKVSERITGYSGKEAVG